MTELDDDLVPEIAAVIDDEVGTTVTFSTPELKAHDPKTGKVIKAGTKEYTIKATPPFPATTKRIGGEHTKKGDYEFLIKGSPTDIATGVAFEPELNWEVTYRSLVYRIAAIGNIASGDSLAARHYLLRR